MQVFRLSRKKYSQALSGKGAAIQGARWNSIGTELIYCAESRSLAMAEVAVHLTYGMIPNDFLMLTIEISDQLEIPRYQIQELPDQWNLFPHKSSTQVIGDRFVSQGVHLACCVPSVVVSGDWNVLINPRHEQFKQVKIIDKVPFIFDRRLFKS